MRVAILADPLDNQSAGVHVYTKELVNAIIALGKEKHFVLIRQKVDNELPIEQVAVPNINLPIGFASLRLFFIVPYILRRLGVDAVFEPAHFGPFNLPKRIKRLTMIHDLTPILFPQYHRWHSQLLQKIFLRGILKRTDWVITNSTHTSQDLERVYPFTNGKNTSILLGRNQAFQPTHNIARVGELGISRPYFIFVGTIEPRKNLKTLLAAFKTFCSKIDSHELVIVGAIGWKSESFETILAQHPYRTRIHYLGFVDFQDLPILYTHATAMVYPSEYEGFGLPLIEAASCGTQIITARNSSLVEVGEPVAHFFETFSSDELSDRFQDAISNPRSAEVMLQHAAQFSWEDCATAFIGVVKHVCRL